MEINKASVSDMFSWLNASFGLVRHNLRTFTIASLLSIAVIIVIFAILAIAFFGMFGFNPAQLASSEGIQSIVILYAIAIVFGVLLMPPFVAGWIKMCQKLANNQSAGATEIFQAYNDADLWKKLVIFCLLCVVLNIAILAIFIMAFGAAGFGQDMQAFMMAQVSGDPNAIASLPGSFWLAYFGIIIISNFLQLIFMLGFCQISLRDGDAVDSLKLAFAAVAKNFISLLIFTLVAFLAILVAAFMFGLVLALLIFLLALIHEALAGIAGVILYAVLLLTIYPIMFSFIYFLWKGMLGNDEPTTTKNTEFLV
jgi:hypothetical protein